MEDSTLVRVLKALADPRRFRMVREIATVGELSCGQIAERFDLAQPTISHHLKILTDARVLVVRREGQHGFLSVDRALVATATALLSRRLTAKPARRAGKRRA